jgi:hypothetical protein
MTDNNDIVKIYSYENDRFIEVPEIYHSVDSNDITFIKNERIFKIDIPNNVMVGSKRKMEDSIYIHDDESAKRIKKLEEINKKHLEDKFKFISMWNTAEHKSKILQIENNKLKAKLLETKVENEVILSERNKATELCNKFVQKILNERQVDN